MNNQVQNDGPPVFYWLVGNQRTGGSYLADLLRINDAGCPLEHFNPKVLVAGTPPAEVLRYHVQHTLERNGAIVGGKNPHNLSGRFIGCKIALSQLDLLNNRLRLRANAYDVMRTIEDAIAARLPIKTPAPVIYLNRLNFAAQAISRLRVAMTQQWHVYAGEEVEAVQFAYDDHRVRQYVRHYQAEHERWVALLEVNQVDYMPLYYEQLTGPTLETALRMVLTFLGHPAASKNKPLALQHHTIRRRISGPEQARFVTDWLERNIGE